MVINLTLASEYGNSDAMDELGYYYEDKDDEKMMKYYKMAIENGNSEAMNNFGYYFYKKGDYENMMKYLMMAIEKNNSNAMNNLGIYYYKQKDYNNMIKYYLMAIAHNNYCLIDELCLHYKNVNDKDNMIKYVNMAVQHGLYESVKNHFTNEELFLMLKNIRNIKFESNFDSKIKEKLKELVITKRIHILNNKINLASKIKDCDICYEENTINIPLECCHYYCTECYIKLRECPLCKM
jgi:TPR repeat protein